MSTALPQKAAADVASKFCYALFYMGMTALQALMLEKAAAKDAMKRKEIKSAEEVVDSALEAHERAQKDLKKSRMVRRPKPIKSVELCLLSSICIWTRMKRYDKDIPIIYTFGCGNAKSP
eukprot:scaffold137165_cov19-Prasinocladus_malaysianus.AAC.1